MAGVLSTTPTGRWSDFERLYKNEGGNVFNPPRSQDPARTVDPGAPFPGRPPMTEMTATTDSQMEPYVPYRVDVILDKQNLINHVNDGNFFFGFDSQLHKSSVNKAMPLWQLNESFMSSHIRHYKQLRTKGTVEEILSNTRDSFTRKNPYSVKKPRPEYPTSVLDSSNAFHLSRGNVIETLNEFLNVIDYLGVSSAPLNSKLNRANKYSTLSKVKNMTFNAEGRTKVPNIFRATRQGEEVGFVVKKFTNPHAFINDEDMSFAQICDHKAPLQIWPVTNGYKTFPTSGLFSKYRYTDGPMGAERFLNQNTNTMSGKQNRNYVFPDALPDGMRESKWDERDPQKIDLRYCDYICNVYKEPNSPDLKMDGSLVCKTGYYIPVGKVRASVPHVPSVEEVAKAVCPSPTSDISFDYSRLLSDYPVEIHITHPDMNLYRSRTTEL